MGMGAGGMNFHHRYNCRLCGRKNIERVVALDPIPLPRFHDTREAAIAEPLVPIDLYMCSDCGHVQQLDIPEDVWDGYTYHNTQSKVMLKHFAESAAKIIERYAPPPGSLVIDIGSNDGSFLRHFKDAGYRVLGVELVKEIAEEATRNGIDTVGEPLSYAVARSIRERYGAASLVLAFNVFAHTDDLNDMMRGVQVLLDKNGLFVFEAQYLMDVVQKTLLATIFHEHLSHHSVKAMSLFLSQYFMQIVDVERVPVQHGSIIGYVQFAGGPRTPKLSSVHLLALEEALHLGSLNKIREFGGQIAELRKSVSSFLKEAKNGGAKIAAFGAARSGPGLISMLGLSGLMDCIFDDHPQKIGKFCAGDGLQIKPTSELLEMMPDYTVMLAWVPAEQIMEANNEYLRRGGKFIVLCPNFRVVSAAHEMAVAA